MPLSNQQTRGVELGYAESTSAFTTTTTGSYQDVTGLSVAVTVGTRPILVTAFASYITHSVANGSIFVTIREGSTDLNFINVTNGAASEGKPLIIRARLAPSAGSHTYKLSTLTGTAGTVTVPGGATGPAHIHVVEI